MNRTIPCVCDRYPDCHVAIALLTVESNNKELILIKATWDMR